MDKEKILLNKNNRTYNSKSYLNDLLRQVDNIQNDPKKEKRLKDHLCTVCMYTPFMHTADIKRKTCANDGCVEEFYGSSVGGNKYCTKCSENYNQCVYCGGDMDLKQRKISSGKKNDPV